MDSLKEDKGLSFDLIGRPDYGLLRVKLPPGKVLRVEASAMAAMDSNIVFKTRAKGGLTRLLTGESLFINEFTAQDNPGELCVAPGSPGDIVHMPLRDQTIFLQSSAFLASTDGIETQSKWQGLAKGFFSGQGLFLIRCSGTGDLWCNTFGAITEITSIGDGFVVDTGHVVAFTDGLEYEITKIGGYKSLLFSGEGLVCRFRGAGRVWVQTRTVNRFASWVWPFRPERKSSN